MFPSSEIYGGLAGVYDYGPLGVQLKRNIQQAWWDAMTRHENIVGIDAAVFMHPRVWEASGHVEKFKDPMIDDRVSKKRYRADELIEWFIDELIKRGEEERARKIEKKFIKALQSENKAKALEAIILEERIPSPDSGAFDWTEVREFNLMFETYVGPVKEEENKIYLRPETAQGIFVNFHNVRETARLAVPFGIAQIGKAFRNEIVVRQFLFRMREFEQMEMQYFVKPGKQFEAFERWREERMQWHIDNGIPASKLRFKEHEELAHYADAAMDIEYEFPMGWREVEGIHSRTDFDLSRHQEYSRKKMEYFDPETRERYIPYVVETSTGLDRVFLMILTEAYHEEVVQGDTRVVLRLHPRLAPITVAVFPLVNKHGMPELAREIAEELRPHFRMQYDDKGSIGRRYRRMDEVGTPFCITVDGQSVEDGTVTVRDRDTLEQVRVPREKLIAHLQERLQKWSPPLS